MVGGALQLGRGRFPPLLQQQVPDKDVADPGHAEQQQKCRNQDEQQDLLPKTCGVKFHCSIFVPDDMAGLPYGLFSCFFRKKNNPSQGSYPPQGGTEKNTPLWGVSTLYPPIAHFTTSSVTHASPHATTASVAHTAAISHSATAAITTTHFAAASGMIFIAHVAGMS